MTDRMSKKDRTSHSPEPAWPTPPRGLKASALSLGHEEYVVLSFPLPSWVLPPGLTTAEREVALALLLGKSSDAIAASRGTSVFTVSNQIASLFVKLRVNSRLELAMLCAANDSAADGSALGNKGVWRRARFAR